MRARTLALIGGALLHAATLSGQAAAGRAYIYDSEGYAVPCPDPYVATGMLLFSDLASGALDFPQDLVVERDGSLALSDQGNARIVRISRTGEWRGEIRDPSLTRPAGLCVDPRDGSLYVADAASGSILRFDAAGFLRESYAPPRSDVLPEDYLYSPTRLAVDARGWLFVIGTGSSGGIIQLDGEGSFRGFFGANPASTSLLRRLARAVASDEQKRAQRLQVLQPYTDLALDAEGFITTVTETTPEGQIRRLNPLGVSVFPASTFGEPVPVESEGKTILDPAHLAFVATDDQGIVTVGDRLSLRIFQYSPEGELLFAWGGKGDRRGSFRSISEIALDRSDGTLYVLDGVSNALQAFEPTEFARLVYEGARLYAEGRYSEALAVWLEVRRRDANYPLANKGIARVLLRLGTSLSRRDYLKAAMQHSRDAGDRQGYSEALAAHRRLWLQRAMPYLVVGAVALLGLVVLVSRPRRRKATEGRAPTPFYFWRALVHPFAVMEEVKWAYSPATLGAATLVLVLALGARLVALSATSYHFATWDPGSLSLAREAGRLLLPWLTWVGANSLVTAIFRGEGKLGQIFAASALALVPFIIMTLLLTALSHVLSLEEHGAYAALTAVMWAWMLFLFLLGAATVHGYSLRRAIGTSVLSVAGIVILWGVAVLVLGLIGTFAGFIIDLVKEVSLRA